MCFKSNIQEWRLSILAQRKKRLLGMNHLYLCPLIRIFGKLFLAPLAPLIPTNKGVSLLIDCGANVDARASHLVQFAKMGSIYMENVLLLCLRAAMSFNHQPV